MRKLKFTLTAYLLIVTSIFDKEIITAQNNLEQLTDKVVVSDEYDVEMSKDAYNFKSDEPITEVVNVNETEKIKWEVGLNIIGNEEEIITLVETVPNYLTVEEDSIVPTPSEVVINVDGSSTITWIFNSATRSAVPSQVTYTTVVDKKVEDATVVSSVSAIESGEISKTAEKSLTFSTRDITPTIQVNNTAIYKDEDINYIINLENTVSTPTDFEVYEIIPTSGENFPTSASRVSNFNGDFNLSAINQVPSNTTILYSFDPNLNYGNVASAEFKTETDWGVSFDINTVTAIKFEVSSLAGNTTESIDLTFNTSSNQSADVYTNNVQIITTSETIISNTVSTAVQPYNLSGVVWGDDNANGLIDGGEIKLSGQDVYLHIYNSQTGSYSAVTTNGTVQTASDGSYTFTDLTELSSDESYAVMLKPLVSSTTSKGEANYLYGVNGYWSLTTSGVGGDKSLNSSATLGDNTTPIVNGVVTTDVTTLSGNNFGLLPTSIDISKSTSTPTGYDGSSVKYEIEVINSGQTELTNVVVVDTFSDANINQSSMQLDSVENNTTTLQLNTDYSITGNQVTVFSVAVGDTITLTYSGNLIDEITNGATVVSNNASVSTDLVASTNTNTVFTTLGDVPLTITKSADKAEVYPGEEIVYSVEIENTGNSSLTNVIVNDLFDDSNYETNSAVFVEVLDDSATPISNSRYSVNDTEITINSLEANETLVVNYKVKIRDDYTSSTEISASNTASVKKGDTEVDSNTVEVPILIEDVTIEKAVDKTSASVGETVTYTITVTNDSWYDVTNYTVTDNLNLNGYAEYVVESIEIDGVAKTDTDADGDGVSFDNGEIVVDFANIGANSSVDITFEVIVLAAGKGNSFENFAVLTTSDIPEFSDTTETVQTEVTDLTLNKSVSKTEANVGEKITYTITVGNAGPGTASGYQFSDVLSFVSAGYATVDESSINASDGSTLTFDSIDTISGTLNNIAAGETVTITFDVIVSASGAGQTLSNSAAIEINGVNDSRVDSNQVETEISDVTISKTASLDNATVGEVITYTIEIENNGPGTATNYTFKDTLGFVGSGLAVVNEPTITSSDGSTITFDGTDTISGTLSEIEPGGKVIISFDVTVTATIAANTMTNTAQILVDDNTDTIIESNPVSTTTPHFTIDKSVNETSAVVGQTVTYTIKIKNDGTGIASGYIITDELDFLSHYDVIFSSATASNGDDVDIFGKTIAVELSDVAPGEEVALTFSGVVRNGAEGQTFVNDAQVGLVDYPDSFVNSNTVETEIPKLTISKSDSSTNGVSSVGDIITYTLTITNQGPGTASDFAVNDNISSIANGYAQFVPGSITVSNGASITYDSGTHKISGLLGDIAEGETVTITFQIEVLAAGLNQTFFNHATVVDPTYPDSGQDSNTSIIAIDNVSILKTANKYNAKVGEVITFRVRVENSTDNIYDNYYFEDELDFVLNGRAELIVSSLSSTNGDTIDYDPLTATISSNMNDIPANTNVFITFDVKILDPAKGLSIQNNATIQDLDNPGSTFVTSNTVSVVIDDIGLTKSVNKPDASVGETVIYTIQVKNDGPGASTDYVFTDQLDFVLDGYAEVLEWSLTTSSGDEITYDPATATITSELRTMYSGESIFVRFRIKVLEPGRGQTLTNISSIEDPDFTGSDHESNPVETKIADVSATKTVEKTDATVGESIGYIITITNDGPGEAIGYEVFDSLDFITNGYAQLIAGPSASDGSTMTVDSDNILSGELDNIAAGDSVTVSFAVKVLAAGEGQTLVNAATIGNPSYPETEVVTNAVETDITGIEVSKAVDKTDASVGEEITYTISVTNNGPGVATNYAVIDTMDFLTNNYAILTSGPTASDGSTITYNGTDTITGTLDDIASGETVTVTFSVKVLDAGKGQTFTNSATVVEPTYTESEKITNEVETDIADVVVSKAVDKETSSVDGVITYTITVTNNGLGTAIGYEVNDVMDFLTNNYASFESGPTVSDSSSITFDGTDTISGTLNDIASGETVTITYSVKALEAGRGEVFTNEAEIGNPLYPESEETTNNVVTNIMDVDVSKAVDKSDATVGETISYTITVTNNGPVVMENYEISDTMSFLTNNYAQLVGGPTASDSSTITFDGTDTISGTLDDLAVGNSMTITYSVKVLAAGSGQTFTNAATIGNPTYPETDEITNVVETDITGIEVSKAVDKSDATVGETITYTITVTNNGPGVATNYAVIDTMDFLTNNYAILTSGPTASDSSTITFNGTDTISGTLDDIASGETVTVTFSVKVLDAGKGQTFTNSATVVEPTYVESEVITNEVETDIADVVVSKAVDKETSSVDGVITYTITVTNNGPGTAIGYEVNDVMDFLTNNYASFESGPTASDSSSITFDGTDTISGTLNDIASGDTVTITYSVKALEAGRGEIFTNEAEIGNPLYPESEETTNNVVTNIMDVDVSKAVDKSDATVGETISYTITVTNNGPVVMENYEISDTMSFLANNYAQLVGGPTASDSSTITFDGTDTISGTLDDLAVGNSMTITYSVKVLAAGSGQTFTNAATIGNPTYPETDEVTNVVETDITDVVVSKAVDKTDASVGETITYTISVTNNGPGILSDYVVIDTMDFLTNNYASFESGPTASDSSTITFNGTDTVTGPLNDIAVGETVTVTFSVKVLDAGKGQTFTNSAIVVNPTYVESEMITNEVETDIADVIVSKAVDKETSSVDGVITYTITVTNNGPGTAIGYEVNDVMDFLTNNYASFESGPTASDGSTITFDGTDTISGTLDDIASGETVTITYSVKALEAGRGEIFTNEAEVGNPLYPESEETTNNVVTNIMDVDVSKAVDKSDATIGETIFYTITVTNNGPVVMENYEISDTMSFLTNNYASFETGPTASDGSAITFDGTDTISGVLDDLAVGNSVTITYSVKVLAAGSGQTFTNAATIGNPTYPETDEVTNVVETDITDVVVSKAVDKTDASVGETITYTISVTNNGPGTAIDYEINDVMDFLTNNYASFESGPTASDSSTITFNGTDTITGTLDDIASGETVTISFSVKVLDAGKNQMFTNQAEIGNPLYPESEQTTNTVETNTADIVVSKAVDKTDIDAGEEVTYTITITNNGSGTAIGYELSDTMDFLTNGYATLTSGPTASDSSSITFDGTDTISGTLNDIASGETVTITFSVKALESAKGEVFTNEAIIGNPLYPESEEMTNSVDTDVADLDIVKVVDKNEANVGEEIAYTITITNTGDTVLSNYELTDTMSFLTNGYAQLVSVPTADDGSTITYNGVDTISGVLNDIAVGDSVTITYSVKVLASGKGEVFTNTATIVNPTYPESEEITNTVETDIVDFEISKAVDKSDASAGEEVTYTITIKNTGEATLSNYELTDTMDFLTNGYAQLVNGPTASDGSTITFDSVDTISGTLDDIAGGETVTVTFTVRVLELGKGEKFTNQANIVNPLYPETTTDSNSTETDIMHVAISKTVNRDLISADGLFSYTIFIENIGNNTVTDYVFVDTMDFLTNGYATMFFDPIASDGSTITFDGVDTVSGLLNDIAPGGVVRINFVLQANESGVGEVLLNTASVGNPLYPGSIGSVEDSNQVETEIAPFIINKEVDKESANVGEILTYTITAENLLETQVFDSGIFDTISNIEYVSFVEGSLEIIGGKGITIDVGTDSVTVDFEEIAAKEEISITFQVVVEEPAKGKTICNEASVELDTFFGKQIYSGIACTGITDLAIEKSVDKTLVDVNEELTYEIKITNNGDGTASDFYFSDTMEFLRDGYATFVNGSIVSSDSSVLTFDSVDTVSGVLNDIAPGEEVIIKFVVKPTEAGAEKELFNSATVGHPDYELTEVSSNQVVTRVNKLLVDASMINYFMYLLLLLLLLIIVRKMYVKYYIYR